MARLNSIITVFSMALSVTFFSVPVPAGESDLAGIYRQTIQIDRDGMMFKKGDSMMSEMIIMGTTPDKTDVTINLGHKSGVVCTLEDGKITNVTATGFKVTAKDEFFGDVCQLDFSVRGDTLTIVSETGCRDFCGYGASFKTARLKKVCNTPTTEAVYHLKDMFFVSKTNVRACK